MAVQFEAPPAKAEEIQRLMHEAASATSGHVVFGDPIERDGVTLVTAARVRGGAGGGSGSQDGPTRGMGWGGGAGTSAEPVGAYIIRDGDVRWQPALDVTALARRFVVAWMFVALAGIGVARRRARAAAKEKSSKQKGGQ